MGARGARAHKPVVYAKRADPTYLLPELILKFTLPTTHALGLARGPYEPVLGVVIRTGSRVEIAGKTLRFLEGRSSASCANR
jgi:hypothetical protein